MIRNTSNKWHTRTSPGQATKIRQKRHASIHVSRHATMHKDAFLFSGHAPIPSTRGIPQIILGIPQKSLWYAPNCEGTNEFKTYHNCLSWHATILLHFKKTGAYLISVPNRTTICLALRATFACRIVACHNSTVHLFAGWLRGCSYRERTAAQTAKVTR